MQIMGINNTAEGGLTICQSFKTLITLLFENIWVSKRNGKYKKLSDDFLLKRLRDNKFKGAEDHSKNSEVGLF